MTNKIINLLTFLIIILALGCKRNIQKENTNRSSKIITTIPSYFNEVKGFKIYSNYNSKQPIQKLNIKYDSLIIKFNFIDDRAYLSIDKENNTFIDWKPININFNYDVSFEDTEKDIHLLLQNNNISEGYLLFPASSNESVKYSFYYFTIEKLKYIGEYEYYPFKEGSFIYDENKQKLYISSDKEYQLTKKDGKEKNDFSKEIVEKDLQLINEEKEKFKNIKKWHGAYSFDFGGVHMGEEFEGNVTFKINNQLSTVNFNKNEESLEILNATKDTIQLKGLKGDIYKIYKDKQGSFNVSGHSIYMLNPPNESYLLTKEK
jgi:hypothetical protein